MNEKNSKIRIVNGDKEFELEGSLQFIEDMLKRFADHIPPKIKPPKVIGEMKAKDTATQTKATEKEISISEFIRKLKLKRHTDIVLAFGYYLENYSGFEQFGPADINNCYYEAKMESSNTSQMFAQLIKRGHIMLAKKSNRLGKTRKLYTLTNTGIDFMKNKLKTLED